VLGRDAWAALRSGAEKDGGGRRLDAEESTGVASRWSSLATTALNCGRWISPRSDGGRRNAELTESLFVMASRRRQVVLGGPVG
jgi:hypothetical protein